MLKMLSKNILQIAIKSFFLFFLLISNICDACLIFLHIPKTGGTTIHELLKENFNKSQFYPFPTIATKIVGVFHNDGPTKNQMKEIFRLFPNIDQEVAWGHFPMWFFREKDPNYETSYFFTALRDPVERILSHDRHRVKVEKAQGLKGDPDPLKITSNFMCKMLCSDPTLKGEKLLNDAIRNLSRMNFIIFMDDFENGVRTLFKELNLHVPEIIPHQNVTGSHDVSPEIIEKIKAHNSLDVQLYEYAIKNFR
jgi:sulfotransferase famil protein